MKLQSAIWIPGRYVQLGETMKYRVFYAKNPTFDRRDTNLKNLSETHVMVKELDHKMLHNLDDVYWLMQSENWSPNGEARELIQSLGLHHTSMSIGDVIADYPENVVRWYVVAPTGFNELS